MRITSFTITQNPKNILLNMANTWRNYLFVNLNVYTLFIPAFFRPKDSKLCVIVLSFLK